MNNIMKLINKLENLTNESYEIIQILNKLTCNHCKYYQGVHNVPGHAPCYKWDINGVSYNDLCSRWEEYNKNN